MSILKIKKLYCAVIVSICLILSTSQSQAMEELKYNDSLGVSLIFQIDKFLQEQYKSNSKYYDIASIDLNNDGILEHILKRKTCDIKKNLCTYIIIAEKAERILLLSKIRAHRLVIDSNASYGIKNILAFRNKKNEYNYDIYMWSPKENMYIMSKQHTKD